MNQKNTEIMGLRLRWDEDAAEKARQKDRSSKMTEQICLDEFFSIMELYTPTMEQLRDVTVYSNNFTLR